jgi:DNA invertase Pin-like site-specific DNA recombinase
MNDAGERRFDIVLVWSCGRFARSTKHLILGLEEFRNLGVDFLSYQENIDTSTRLPTTRSVMPIEQQDG